MRKILCPIDFSEVSLNALEFAVAIAEKENSSITLLNIFSPEDFNKILEKDHVKEEYEKLQEIAESKLKAISEEIMLMSKKKPPFCKHILKSGEIVDVLKDLADEDKYDLIVMGTTGHSAYERKYLGGKAEQIIHATQCSVMCVPQDHTFHGIEHIVYATDYQEEDKLAIQQISQLSTVLNARVTVLHVSHHNDAIDKAIYEQFKEEMGHFVADNVNIAFKRVIFHHVSEGIDEYMKQMKADLLVLLNKKQNFLKILFHTSLIDHLDKFTEYPLMIIKL